MNLIVYHVFCVNNYKNIFNQQVGRIISSGLYDWCDVIEITAIGANEQDLFYLERILSSFDKFKINFYRDNKQEFYAINKIWEYSQNNEGQVLYFHTKGVWNNFTDTKTRSLSDLKGKGVYFWREMMEYFVIDKYENCLEKLNSYDNCGVTCNDGWYWGNFWWSNLSFIKRNPILNYGSRWLCETWLNKNREHKSFEFFHYDWNPYFTCLPPDIYKNPEKYLSRIPKVKSAFYGTLGVQMDEFWPICEKKMIEVTNILKNNKGIVSNEFFGDPNPGYIKNLIINFSYDNEDYFITLNENKNYNLENIVDI